MEDVDYLQRKLYRALNVPISRLESNSGFNMGRTTEISRDEVKFFKFIERLRSKFAMLFLDLLKKQLILKGILTVNDWEKIYQDINFIFNKDSYFNELKENELLREKVDMLNVLSSYEGKYFSTQYIRKHILKQSDDLMKEIDIQMSQEQEKALEAQMQQQQIQTAMAPQEEQGTKEQQQVKK